MRTDLAYLGSSYERLVFGRHPRTRRIVRLKKLRMAERAGLQDYTLLADFLRWGCWVRYRRLGTSDACLAFVSHRRAGQRLGIVSHISRLSRANERNHPAAAKRLWRDSRVLSRLVSRLSRTWQQRFVFLFRSECAPLQHFPVPRV